MPTKTKFSVQKCSKKDYIQGKKEGKHRAARWMERMKRIFLPCGRGLDVRL